MNQPYLFNCPPDTPLKGAGHRRNTIGLLVEEFVCAVMDWQLMPKGRQDPHCPDAETPRGLPIEVKSVHCAAGGVKGKAVVYAHRLAKDEEHAPTLHYAFFCHHSTGKGKAKSTGMFLDRLAADVPVLVIAEASAVREVAKGCKLCKPKKALGGPRVGYNRAGYCDGYHNLPIEPLALPALTRLIRRNLWGREFSILVLYQKPFTKHLPKTK